MTAIVCIEDRGGILFNSRRVGRDYEVRRDIARDFDKVYMTEYSRSLFSDVELDAAVRVSPLSEGVRGDVCFIESGEIKDNLENISRIVLYRWNRRYPSDVKLGFEPADAGFRLVSTTDFVGQAHERITKEVYIR